MDIFNFSDQSAAETARLERQNLIDADELLGNGSSPPIQSDTDFSNAAPTILQKLGSFDLTGVARDLGAAVGNVERQLSTVDDEFKMARTNVATGNSLGTWWQYATTTDKIMVGLAAAGVLVAVYALVKE